MASLKLVIQIMAYAFLIVIVILGLLMISGEIWGRIVGRTETKARKEGKI